MLGATPARPWRTLLDTRCPRLVGALSICGIVCCTSFAELDDSSSLAGAGSPGPAPAGSGGGGAGAVSLPPGSSGEAVPTPGGFSGSAPVDMASADGGTSSMQPDAGQDPVAEADAGMPSVDPPGPIEVPECSGWALELDGESFAVVPRMVENDFTLEAWIRTSPSASGPRDYEGRALFDSDVIGAGDDFLSTIADDRVAFGIGGSVDVGVRGLEVVTTNEWVHVALTRNAGNGQLQIFVNGALDGATNGSNLSPLTGQPQLAFGGAATSDHFIGSMDEIRVWNVVRSAAQISANMRERLTGSENGLVGYYTFEDRGENQATDSSAIGATATLVGSASYVSSTVLCPPGQTP